MLKETRILSFENNPDNSAPRIQITVTKTKYDAILDEGSLINVASEAFANMENLKISLNIVRGHN